MEVYDYGHCSVCGCYCDGRINIESVGQNATPPEKRLFEVNGKYYCDNDERKIFSQN